MNLLKEYEEGVKASYAYVNLSIMIGPSPASRLLYTCSVVCLREGVRGLCILIKVELGV